MEIGMLYSRTWVFSVYRNSWWHKYVYFKTTFFNIKN